MRIADVRPIPLRGATQDTGWPGATDLNEQMNTLLEELVTPAFALDADRLLPVPTGPGLGIALNPDALARYSR